VRDLAPAFFRGSVSEFADMIASFRSGEISNWEKWQLDANRAGPWFSVGLWLLQKLAEAPIHAETEEADIHPSIAGNLSLHRRKAALSPDRP
jgi:hypothetical protein